MKKIKLSKSAAKLERYIGSKEAWKKESDSFLSFELYAFMERTGWNIKKILIIINSPTDMRMKTLHKTINEFEV